MGLFGWIFNHKLLILFIAATAAFGIATITLAVAKSNLSDDLTTCEELSAGLTSTSTTTATESTSTTESPEDMADYRLPTHVTPLHYDLTLHPDLTTGNFGGKVIATINVNEATPVIKIHSHNLTITKVTIDDNPARVEYLTEYELLVISPEDGSQIAEGSRNVAIEYNGDMKDRIVGLYTSSYTAEDGASRMWNQVLQVLRKYLENVKTLINPLNKRNLKNTDEMYEKTKLLFK